MSIPILITDDSALARKLMARSLPDGWDVEVSFANDGVECVDAIKQGKGDILFLDLNMPGMDGYEVLEAIRTQDLPTLTIVVSGDVQSEARQRVKELGALDFIKKPIDKEKLTEVLDRYGILTELTAKTTSADIQVDVDLMDCYREVANVAMGRAGELLAKLLGVFFHLPIPDVAQLDAANLEDHLAGRFEGHRLSAITQGFIGSGIAGEAVLLIEDVMLPRMARLMSGHTESGELELLMSVASIVIGAGLGSVAQQLDLEFSHGLPEVLGHGATLGELFPSERSKPQQVMKVEIHYEVEVDDIRCTLLLLFTEDSLDRLNERVGDFLE